MPSDLHKTIAGALLLGTSLLSGNAVLITAAGGIGVNWASEGLAGLWQQARTAFAPGTPLSRAAERAIRQAIDQLEREFAGPAGAQADLRAFALVRDCAAATAVAQYPAGPHDPLAAQQALNAALDQLLFGHDERAVALIHDRLIERCATALRAELAGNPEAWRLFHGWLIEQLASQAGAMAATLARLPSVLAQLADQAHARAALSSAAAQIEALGSELRAAIARLEQQAGGAATTFENVGVRAAQLNQAGGDIVQGAANSAGPHPPPARAATPASFRNQDVTVTGSLNQAGGNIYHSSAHAEGGGSALVINTAPPGAAPVPPVALAEQIANQQAILAGHRRRLGGLLEQRAALGSAFAPPSVAAGIAEARACIGQAKAALLGLGVVAEHLPNDGEPAQPDDAPQRH